MDAKIEQFGFGGGVGGGFGVGFGGIGICHLAACIAILLVICCCFGWACGSGFGWV